MDSFKIKMVVLIVGSVLTVGTWAGVMLWRAIKRPQPPRRPTETNVEAARRRAQERAAQPKRPPVPVPLAPPVPMPRSLEDKQASRVTAELQAHRALVAKLQQVSTGDIAGDTSRGTFAKNEFNPRGQYNLPVRWRIEYVDQQGVLTWRTIRVEHLNLRSLRLEAFCESRQDHRSFFVRSIRKATDPVSGFEVDLDSYVNHVRKKRAGKK